MLSITVEQIKEYKSRVGWNAALIGKCYARAKSMYAPNLPEKLEMIKQFENEYNNAPQDEKSKVNSKILKYGF